MKFTLNLSLICFVFADSANLRKLDRKRKLFPSDVGVIHTEAFERLGEKYANVKPTSFEEIVQDICLISSSYCPEDDEMCVRVAHERTLQESKRVQNDQNVEHPENFDSRVKKVLDDAILEIELLSSQNANEILDQLIIHRDYLENMDNVDIGSQMVGIATISVGIESTQLWHDTIVDPTHSLHDMIGYFDTSGKKSFSPEGNRMLQNEDDGYYYESSILYYGWIVVSDVDAAYKGGLEVMSEITSDPSIIISIISKSIMASAKAAFEEEGYYKYYGGDDDGDDDYYYETNRNEDEGETDIGGKDAGGKDKGGKDKGGKDKGGKGRRI